MFCWALPQRPGSFIQRAARLVSFITYKPLYSFQQCPTGDIIKMMQQLHASFGGFSGLAEVPLERLGGRRSKEYEYSSIEDILDGGNAVEDILIHPHFDLSVDSKVPEVCHVSPFVFEQ